LRPVVSLAWKRTARHTAHGGDESFKDLLVSQIAPDWKVRGIPGRAAIAADGPHDVQIAPQRSTGCCRSPTAENPSECLISITSHEDIDDV
jgi:hypothetical protein